MADPNVTTGALIGATISPVMLILGAHVDALIVGMMAAVFASIWLEAIDNKFKAAAAVLLSAMLAGYGSPVAVSYIASATPVLGGDATRLFCALLIGAFAPGVVPLAKHYIGKKFGGAA